MAEVNQAKPRGVGVFSFGFLLIILGCVFYVAIVFLAGAFYGGKVSLLISLGLGAIVSLMTGLHFLLVSDIRK